MTGIGRLEEEGALARKGEGKRDGQVRRTGERETFVFGQSHRSTEARRGRGSQIWQRWRSGKAVSRCGPHLPSRAGRGDPLRRCFAQARDRSAPSGCSTRREQLPLPFVLGVQSGLALDCCLLQGASLGLRTQPGSAPGVFGCPASSACILARWNCSCRAVRRTVLLIAFHAAGNSQFSRIGQSPLELGFDLIDWWWYTRRRFDAARLGSGLRTFEGKPRAGASPWREPDSIWRQRGEPVLRKEAQGKSKTITAPAAPAACARVKEPLPNWCRIEGTASKTQSEDHPQKEVAETNASRFGLETRVTPVRQFRCSCA